MDKKQFAELMTLNAAAFDKELSESLLKVYWADLQWYRFEDIEAAFTQLRRTSKWFPKIAEIVELVAPRILTIEEQASAAWDDVLVSLRNSRDAHSTDPVIERVVKVLGGWQFLGRKSADDLVWVEKEFRRRYVASVETETAQINRIGAQLAQHLTVIK